MPHCRNGEFMGGFNGRYVDHFKPAGAISAEDYVVGLELLGFRFAIGEIGGEPALYRGEPDPPIPRAWHAHAINIMWAFGPGRTAEALAFLRQRESTPEAEPVH